MILIIWNLQLWIDFDAQGVIITIKYNENFPFCDCYYFEYSYIVSVGYFIHLNYGIVTYNYYLHDNPFEHGS